MDSKNNLKNISNIKSTMLILVVLYHSIVFYKGDWFIVLNPSKISVTADIIATWLNTFHIQTFIMASGFLFYYLKYEKGKYTNKKEYIKKRFQRLMIPYFVVAIFWVMPISYFFYKTSIKDFIINYLLGFSPSQLWFLPMLFIVCAIFCFLSDKIKISKLGLVVIGIFFTFLGTIFTHFNIQIYQLGTAILYTVFFYFGGYLYKNINYKDYSFKKILIYIISAIVLFILYYFSIKSDLIVIKLFSKIIKTLLSLIEVFIAYIIISKITKYTKQNKIIEMLEENSFGIYLFHQQIIYFVIYYTNDIFPPIIVILSSFVVSLLISYIIVCILKRSRRIKTLLSL